MAQLWLRCLPPSCDDLLYVGSNKTLIRHTEGTARVAVLLKASLAIQSRTIPPNMHFTKLSPNIKPETACDLIISAIKENLKAE